MEVVAGGLIGPRVESTESLLAILDVVCHAQRPSAVGASCCGNASPRWVTMRGGLYPQAPHVGSECNITGP